MDFVSGSITEICLYMYLCLRAKTKCEQFPMDKTNKNICNLLVFLFKVLYSLHFLKVEFVCLHKDPHPHQEWKGPIIKTSKILKIWWKGFFPPQLNTFLFSYALFCQNDKLYLVIIILPYTRPCFKGFTFIYLTRTL